MWIVNEADCIFFKKFSPILPSGPSWSSSRDVRLCFCLYNVPFPCDFFLGLSLALRSHDQIPASHWPSDHMIRNSWRFFVCFILRYPRVTPYVPKMAAKLTSSYISSNFKQLACHLVAAFQTIPLVSS